MMATSSGALTCFAKRACRSELKWSMGSASVALLIAAGKCEERDGTVALRQRDGEQAVMPLAEAVALLRPQAVR